MMMAHRRDHRGHERPEAMPPMDGDRERHEGRRHHKDREGRHGRHENRDEEGEMWEYEGDDDDDDDDDEEEWHGHFGKKIACHLIGLILMTACYGGVLCCFKSY